MKIQSLDCGLVLLCCETSKDAEFIIETMIELANSEYYRHRASLPEICYEIVCGKILVNKKSAIIFPLRQYREFATDLFYRYSAYARNNSRHL